MKLHKIVNSNYLGIYRRYYPDLLFLQDPETVALHKSYWTLKNLNNVIPLLPEPKKFLHPSITVDQLAHKSIVAVNMATLRLNNDFINYDTEKRNLITQD